MNVEPQKFFIGLMDFFSILLPGALVTWLLMDQAGPWVLGKARYQALAGTAGWAALLFASYLLGHLVFLLGSWLDGFYDWLRRRTLNAQIARLAQRGGVSPWPLRLLVWLVFKQERNLAVGRAVWIKEQALAPLQAQSAINAFQWAKSWLTQEGPECLATVQRFEADSKFFRCLVVVLLLMAGVWAYRGQWPLAALGVGLTPLALWRYLGQRYKATNQAYWSVITLTARAGRLTFEPPAPVAGAPTQAAGVVYRRRWWRQAGYLLVESDREPGQWVLPQGAIEDAEPPRQTAVREVHGQAGVWARIEAELTPVCTVPPTTAGLVQPYLMQAVGRGRRRDPERRRVWLPLAEAVALLKDLETRALLQHAESQRMAGDPRTTGELLQRAEQRRVRP